jgi:ABC-2 type transport system ATP-binding protein
VTVDVSDDRPDVLRVSLAGSAESRPGGIDAPMNAVLQAVLSADVPVLSYEVEGARLADAFHSATEQALR